MLAKSINPSTKKRCIILNVTEIKNLMEKLDDKFEEPAQEVE